MVALTPKSITKPDELRTHLNRIRKRGWECAVDDVALGLTALAAPVHGRDGEIVCCISIAGLTPQMVTRGRPIHLERILAAAEQIERRLKGGAR
jgi:DNA-binding IclR family transcriptional regulator